MQQNLLASNSTTVVSAQISPLNRLSIKLTELPEKPLTTTLSSDKKTLVLNIHSATIKDNLQDSKIIGDGIIKEVAFQKIEDGVSVTVNFTEARGYTTAMLPYSKNIILEVFDWSKLTEEEDAYRTGLLSLEDNIISEAKADLLKGVAGGIADAATYLGIVLLKEGKINSAFKNIRFAEIKGSKLPDIFAALSQIYELKQQIEKSNSYAKLYTQQTGEKSVPKINIPVITEKDDFCSEPTEHLNSVISQSDTNNSNTTQIDTINKFENILAKNNDSNTNKSFLEFQNSDILKYLVYVICAIALLLLYLYLRWRKKQIELQTRQNLQKNKQIKTNSNSNINADRRNNNSDNQKKSNITKSASNNNTSDFGSIINKTIGDASSSTSTGTNTTTNNNNIIINNSSNSNRGEDKAILEYPKTEEERSKKAKELLSIMSGFTQKENIDEKTKYQRPKKRSANVELAVHLAEEQKKIKNRHISEIPSIVELDSQKIGEIAKKLGVEKSSLETKQNLEKIKNDDDEISKLGEKFGLK